MLARNPALWCVYHGLQMALFPMAVFTVFLQRHLGMSMTEIMLAQAAFGGTLALCEFPSGHLADRVGYRLSLLAAAAVSVLAWSAFTVADDLAGVVVAQCLLGASVSLISGCLSALLYESLVSLDAEGQFGVWTGRMRAAGQASEGTAALVAGALFALSPRLPFAVETGVWVVGGLVAWALVEPPRHAPVVRGHLTHIRGMLGFVARHPGIRAAFALGTWLGPLWAVANYFVAAGALLSDRLGRRLGLMRALALCVVALGVGYLGMGVSHALLGFGFYYCFTWVRGLSGPILHHAEQRLIPSGDRAGLTSLSRAAPIEPQRCVGPTASPCYTPRPPDSETRDGHSQRDRGAHQRSTGATARAAEVSLTRRPRPSA